MFQLSTPAEEMKLEQPRIEGNEKQKSNPWIYNQDGFIHIRYTLN